MSSLACTRQSVLPQDGASSPGAHSRLGVHKPNTGFAFVLFQNHSQIPIYYKAVH